MNITKSLIMRAAIEAGFALSTGHGQGANKLMPISDVATLTEFYAQMKKAEREHENKVT